MGGCGGRPRETLKKLRFTSLFGSGGNDGRMEFTEISAGISMRFSNRHWPTATIGS